MSLKISRSRLSLFAGVLVTTVVTATIVGCGRSAPSATPANITPAPGASHAPGNSSPLSAVAPAVPTWSTAPGAVKATLPDSVVSNMKSILLKFVDGHLEPSNSVMRYKIRALRITIQGENRHNNQVEMDFLVGYEHELDIARPEDAPVLKGMTAYLNENKSSLSPQAVKAVNDLIARWESQLRTYMNTYTPSYQAYVEKAQVDARNNLVPGTAILYAEEDYTASGLLSADEVFKNMWPTDQEVERQAYDGAKMAAEQAAATDSAGQGR